MKKCTICNFNKELKGFSKNSKMRDGFLHQCKKCVSKKVKKWKIENPEEVKRRRIVTYLKKRQENIQSAIEWGRKNKEKRKTAKDKWRAKNKPLTNHYSKNYSYREKGADGSHSLEEYQLKLQQFKGVCGYCKVRKAGTKDHIVPLSKGGTNYIDNIIPACVSCNSSKRDKPLSEWQPLTLIN